MLGEAVRDATARRVTLDFHAGTGPVRIAVLPDADLEITGETSLIGPGYHAYVIARITPVLEELDYVWADDSGDPRAAMYAWLARELADGATRIGVPAGLCFLVDDAAVLTSMGPRDAAWKAAVIAEPAKGADAFAWVDDGPGQLERSRALLAMWLEVPWREPLDAEERALMVRVDGDLKAARKADRSLALPYAEWAELREHLGEDEKAADLRAKATGPAVIGYRRHPMEVELDGAWTFVLPGAFVGSWEEDRYWATDGDRMIEITCLETAAGHSSAELLAIAPEAHAVIERLDDGTRCGRAEAYDEGDVHVVHGLMASAPGVAIITCKAAREDQAWALETWRSLHRG